MGTNGETRWLVAADGTRIAYAIRGQGAGPVFVLTNGLTTSTWFWRRVLPRWCERHVVLTWDLPGHGLSGPALSARSAKVEAQADFVLQLMAAERIERAVQIGWSTGCQVVLEVYRRAPERCLALALILGAARRVLDTTRLPLPGGLIAAMAKHAPKRVFSATFRTLSQAARAPFGPALGVRLGLVDPSAELDDVRGVLRHIPTVHPPTLQRLLASLAIHDGSDVLASARVPVLLVAGDEDPFAPASTVGVPLHELAPEATLLRLPRGTHTALLDHAAPIAEAVEELAQRA
jgi:pimeloyl-ACP methyl ester carboxylesterase